MRKKYLCFQEDEHGSKLDIDEIFYLIEKNLLIEITLDNGYTIRQRKDITIDYEMEGGEIETMYFGTVYCDNGNAKIESVWHGRGEEALMQYIKTCEEYI